MSSNAVLVLDIDGVVSLAQPGSALPWYATLQADWGFGHDEMARDFFRGDFLEVLRGREKTLNLMLQNSIPNFEKVNGNREEVKSAREAALRALNSAPQK